MLLGKRLVSAMALAAVAAAHPTGLGNHADKHLVSLAGLVMPEPTGLLPIDMYAGHKDSSIRSSRAMTTTTTTESVRQPSASASASASAIRDGAGAGDGAGDGDGPATNSPSPSPSPSPEALDGFGIAYAPYRRDHSCKSAGDIADDFNRFAGAYSLVRIYGTDCGQVPLVYRAAKAHGLRLFLGIWDIAAVGAEVATLVEAVGADWARVHTVSVGNELVNARRATPGDVVAAVRLARSLLRAAGYRGPVVAVDTFNAVQAHPELCAASDYCAVNAHAFFDATSAADQAGPWLVRTVADVAAALDNPTQPIVVAESGWPTAGDINGRAVPGLEQQRVALQSLRGAFALHPGDLILFSAFNDLWKPEWDRYWGIDGAVSSSDQ